MMIYNGLLFGKTICSSHQSWPGWVQRAYCWETDRTEAQRYKKEQICMTAPAFVDMTRLWKDEGMGWESTQGNLWGCCELQHGVLVGHHEHRSLWRCSSWWVWRNTVDGMQIMTQQEWLKKKLKEEAGKLKKICISLNYKIWRVPAFLMAIKELIA